MPVNDSTLEGTLRRVFGFSGFRANQKEIILALMSGQDAFAVMPTGGGKSLCYQLPSVMMPGTCLVVSPLIALMKDQVDGARSNGIRAAYLNSSLDEAERRNVMQQLLSNSLDLLYIAPERFALDHFQEMLRRVQISLAVVDEAHCISEWGHDFRPDYLSLSALVTLLPEVPVAAFTATATHRVVQDIRNRLRLRTPYTVRASFDRPNLYYEVVFKDNADAQLVSLLRQNPGRSGIIYRTSRKSVNDTAAMLQSKGFRVLPYHAGLSDEDRRKNQDAFIRDEIDVIVATIAFGMGIDKPDIRFVIHADLPKSIENYYQETGRAGRDGEKAHCTLLFSQADIHGVRFYIDAIAGEQERARALASLSEISAFASSPVCRRKTLLGHFGETFPHENCGSCDICCQPRDTVDCSQEAQMLLSAIVRTEERFGASHIVDIVTGSRNRKILELGHDRLKTWGVGKERSKKFWRQLIDELLVRRIVARSEGLYPVLVLLPKAVAILRKEEAVHMSTPRESPVAAKTKGSPSDVARPELFGLLRALRREIAEEMNIPPYVVFSDRSLGEMAQGMPQSDEELLAVSGVGEVKLRRYGRRFLDLIERYRNSSGGGEAFVASGPAADEG